MRKILKILNDRLDLINDLLVLEELMIFLNINLKFSVIVKAIKTSTNEVCRYRFLPIRF
jgi:hypothetical protein